MPLVRYIILFLLLHISFFATAQNEQRYLPLWELGISPGLYVYQGDLTPYKIGSLKTIMPGLQITAGKYISNSVLVRAGLTVATLQGKDHLYGYKQEYRSYRNYYFKAKFAELQTTAMVPVFTNKFYEQKFQPFITAGVSAVILNTKNSSLATDFSFFPLSDLPTRLLADERKGNRKFLMHPLAGAGARYNTSAAISLTAELLYRFGFSDYIDGFSIAANPKENDHFYSVNVGILISFPDNGLTRTMRKRLRCKL